MAHPLGLVGVPLIMRGEYQHLEYLEVPPLGVAGCPKKIIPSTPDTSMAGCPQLLAEAFEGGLTRYD